jgi:hypothetical protein
MIDLIFINAIPAALGTVDTYDRSHHEWDRRQRFRATIV